MIYFLQSSSTDPYLNLSIEEYLMENMESDDFIFFLWQNENTVVIGRNQNIWSEVNRKKLFSEKGSLARRISGGGAVYHDLGNLNFSFIGDDSRYSVKRQLQFILDVLKKYGVEGEFIGRNDLVVEGRKFSGNAFYKKKNINLHHGTLLVNVDMEKLDRYLNVDLEKLKSKSVKSVKSRVVNLCELNEKISVDGVKKELKRHFFLMNKNVSELDFKKIASSNNVKNIVERSKSDEWIFGENPNFDISFRSRYSWGDIEVNFVIENKIVRKCKVYSDSLLPDLINRVQELMIDVEYDKNSLVNSLNPVDDQVIVRDIQNLIKSKNI